MLRKKKRRCFFEFELPTNASRIERRSERENSGFLSTMIWKFKQNVLLYFKLKRNAEDTEMIKLAWKKSGASYKAVEAVGLRDFVQKSVVLKVMKVRMCSYCTPVRL